MPIIEHFRHSMRHPGGVHLTQAGVDLARRVGTGLGRFDRVITSEMPRAIETAVAMGYAVDEQVALLFSLMSADREFDWSSGWGAFAEAHRLNGQLRLAADVHAGLLRTLAKSLLEDGRMLIVSHGGVIELGVLGLLPDDDFAGWGPSCGYCEGVRLHFEGDKCVGADILRIAELDPST